MVINRSSPVPLHPVVRFSRSPDWADVTPPITMEHSVAIGLTRPLGDLTFTLPYVLARLRRPVRLLECPDGASLPAPRRITAGIWSPCRRGRRRFQASFRRAWRFAPSGDWASGNPAFTDIARISRRTVPARLGAAAGFLACCFSQDLSFRTLVSHQIPRKHLLQFPPAERAIRQCACVTHPDPPESEVDSIVTISNPVVQQPLPPAPRPSGTVPTALVRQARRLSLPRGGLGGRPHAHDRGCLRDVDPATPLVSGSGYFPMGT